METHHQFQCCHGSKFLGQSLPACSWRPIFLARPFYPSLVSCSSPRWDSNAETFRPRNNFTSRKGQEQGFQNKRRWWSDEDGEFDEEEEVAEETSSGIFEEATDSVWFLQIFKSYGWTLPVILTSWLLSSGPKAFLMALILPLGQSALALAFEKLWGPSERKPKRKPRKRRKPRPRNNSTRVEEESAEEKQKPRKGYQSWVVEENNGSVDRRDSQEKAPSFGGWDDLERSRPTTKSSRAMDGSRRTPMEGGRLSKRERKGDTPLLLRVLIAIFPFLSSWTKML